MSTLASWNKLQPPALHDTISLHVTITFGSVSGRHIFVQT